MKITFWGVRGSIASPGAETAKVGGNTSCVEVACGDTRIILDAGTGLRALGDKLVSEGSTEAHLLLSHYHWDHIQGLPFFVPTYLPSSRLTVYGAAGPMPIREVLAHQMCAPVFPVPFMDVAARFHTRELSSGDSVAVGGARVTAAKLNHPGGVLGYRIEHGGRTVVYATDTEHFACPDPAILGLARGADVLIYDAQYTPEEYRGEAGPSKAGWGHSTFEVGRALAREAGVGTLVLFHHDPRRTDAAVAEIVDRARPLFSRTVAAREGSWLDLSDVADAA
jgi:phosphoribosyl 1,2-cyclic phosphodiesterase